MNWFCRLIVCAAVLLSLGHDVQAKLHYFKTCAQNFADLDTQVEVLNSGGVHVRHIFPPNQVIVDYPAGLDIARIHADFIIQSVSEDQVPYMSLSCETDQVLCSFRFMCLIPFAKMGPPIDSGEKNCEGEAPPPTAVSVSRSRLTAEGDLYNANYMIGRMAVALVFMESDGSAENWDANSKQSMFNQAVQALDWWCDKATEHGIDLSFVYEIEWQVPTTYEPIQCKKAPYYTLDPFPGWDFDWVGDALTHLGYSDDWDGLFDYCNALRSRYQCNWAFQAYLVMAENDPDHEFANGSSGYSMPYYAGPYRTRSHPMLTVAYHYESNYYRARVFAHEVGHIVDCPDEYSGAQTCESGSCDDDFGYLSVDNGNCEACNANSVDCMMQQNDPLLCSYTLGHLGWRDSDADGPPDPVDGNTFLWASVFPVVPGDLVRIFDAAGYLVTVIAATQNNVAYRQSSIIWDGKTKNNGTVAMSNYVAMINGGEEFPINLKFAIPPLDPAITDIALSGDLLIWRLTNTWAYVRCFIYDSTDAIISRPIWDKLYSANDVCSLSVAYLPCDRAFKAKFVAWRADGGISQTVIYNMRRHCTWLVGDASGDRIIDISDPVYLVSFIFAGGYHPQPHPIGSGDANCDRAVDLSDCVYIISFLFSGGAEPGASCDCCDY